MAMILLQIPWNIWAVVTSYKQDLMDLSDTVAIQICCIKPMLSNQGFDGIPDIQVLADRKVDHDSTSNFEWNHNYWFEQWGW